LAFASRLSKCKMLSPPDFIRLSHAFSWKKSRRYKRHWWLKSYWHVQSTVKSVSRWWNNIGLFVFSKRVLFKNLFSSVLNATIKFFLKECLINDKFADEYSWYSCCFNAVFPCQMFTLIHWRDGKNKGYFHILYSTKCKFYNLYKWWDLLRYLKSSTTLVFNSMPYILCDIIFSKRH